MPLVHWNPPNWLNTINAAPAQPLPQSGEIGALVHFDAQDTLVTFLNKRRPSDRRVARGRAFHLERVERAQRVPNACGTAPQQPETTLGIEVSGIPGPMP